jgi:transposase InsO family protein
MPWKEQTIVSERIEFVSMVKKGAIPIREICRRYGVSHKTGYKWLERFEEAGEKGLADLSRRPQSSPKQTPDAMEQVVISLRQKHPVWGGRKLNARLLALGYCDAPAPSTITEILRRNDLLNAEESGKHAPMQRFEADEPNALWQMDFKGHFALRHGRCHPLTVIDDCSRFSVGVEACANERKETVQEQLVVIFRRYGLPRRMLTDNGSPWGSDATHRHTLLTTWMMRYGIDTIHGRPYHPQTQGKDERFNRTFGAEVINGKDFLDLVECQKVFSEWRQVYNFERPHESLGDAVPASKYALSPRTYPETPPPIEYGPSDVIRKVADLGWFSFRSKHFKVGRAFVGYQVALRPTLLDGVFDVYFCKSKIAQIDLNVDNGRD